MEAYRTAKRNGGAPGSDGQTFAEIEQAGVTDFLETVREELLTGSYQPRANRRVDIPKDNGKVRTLQISCIRDRVVQGALKLILEAIFEADFCPNSYGFRPRRSPHRALAEVRRSVLRRMSTVIDVDLSKYFDTIRHSVLLDKIARRVQDPQVMHLVKQILKTSGPLVPQGGPFSPLAANIYLNEMYWAFDAIRRKTAEGSYEAVNNYPPAKPEVLRLLPPQRGLTAIGQSQNPRTLTSRFGNCTHILWGEAYCRKSQTLGVLRQSRRFTLKKLSQVC
jgi:group II intron reverse transcriptase/maturase